MTNNKILLAAGAVALSTGIFSATATAATVTATGNAKVLAPLTLNLGAAMEFGDVAGDSTRTSTIVLGTDGMTTAGPFAAVFSSGATDSAGGFIVTGVPTATYSVTLPPSITLGGAGSMTVDNLTHDSTGVLNGAGGATFNVGGTLQIGIAQAVGAYTGTYLVEVNYQ